MNHFLLIALLFSGSVFAVSGKLLANVFSYTGPDCSPPATSLRIHRAIAPWSIVLRNQHEVLVLAHSQTYRFAQTIRVQGAGFSADDSSLLNQFLRILPNMQRIRHIEFNDVYFGPGQLEEFIQILNELPVLETLILHEVRGLETAHIEQLRSNSIRQLMITPRHQTILHSLNSLPVERLPRLNHLTLGTRVLFIEQPSFENLSSRFIVLRLPPNYASEGEFPNYSNSRDNRLWLISTLSSLDGRFSHDFMHTSSAYLQGLSQEELLEPIGPHEIPLIQLFSPHWSITRDLLRRAIGDGQDPRLHLRDTNGNTFAMSMLIHGGFSQSIEFIRLLELLIGDGTRPELHQPNRENYTLAMLLVRSYSLHRPAEYRTVLLRYLTQLIRNAPPGSLELFSHQTNYGPGTNLVLSVFRNIISEFAFCDLSHNGNPEFELLELLVGDGSRSVLHQLSSRNETLAGMIVRIQPNNPCMAARFLFPLLRHRNLPTNMIPTQSENLTIALFLRRNLHQFNPIDSAFANEWLASLHSAPNFTTRRSAASTK